MMQLFFKRFQHPVRCQYAPAALDVPPWWYPVTASPQKYAHALVSYSLQRQWASTSAFLLWGKEGYLLKGRQILSYTCTDCATAKKKKKKSAGRKPIYKIQPHHPKRDGGTFNKYHNPNFHNPDCTFQFSNSCQQFRKPGFPRSWARTCFSLPLRCFLFIPPPGRLSTYRNCPFEITEAETKSQAMPFQPEGGKNSLCSSLLSKPITERLYLCTLQRWEPSSVARMLLPGATNTNQVDSTSFSPSLQAAGHQVPPQKNSNLFYLAISCLPCFSLFKHICQDMCQRVEVPNPAHSRTPFGVRWWDIPSTACATLLYTIYNHFVKTTDLATFTAWAILSSLNMPLLGKTIYSSRSTTHLLLAQTAAHNVDKCYNDW